MEPDRSVLVYRFESFTLDVNRGTLSRAGEEVSLRPKAYAVLCYLVEHNGRLIAREELLDAVWGDAVVTDGVLTQCLINIRKALDDSDHRKIRTVTKRGYVFELPVETILDFDRSSHSSNRSHKNQLSRVAVALMVVALLGAVTYWQLIHTAVQEGQETVSLDLSRGGPAIAVLPFADMSVNQDHQYLGDGMSDEILSLLTRINGLRVVARTSSFALRDSGKSIEKIGEQLNVSHVLQGSVRRFDDRVRVSAQLIDARNSEQVWAASFDREIEDFFRVQDEIAEAIVGHLELSFNQQPLRTQRTNMEAHSLYLQAAYLIGQGSSATMQHAESLLLETIRLDPNSAPAWRELARLRWSMIGTGPSPREDVDSVRDALNRSYEIDPDDPATIAYVAASVGDFDGDLRQAARLYERAITRSRPTSTLCGPRLFFLQTMVRLTTRFGLASTAFYVTLSVYSARTILGLHTIGAGAMKKRKSLHGQFLA